MNLLKGRLETCVSSREDMVVTQRDISSLSKEDVLGLLVRVAEEGGVTSSGKLIVPPDWVKRVEEVLRELSPTEEAMLEGFIKRDTR